MSIVKRALAAVVTVALSGSVALATATPAAADWYEDGVFALPYTDRLWLVDSSIDFARNLGYAEWEALGFPTPKTAQTDYVKYPWSPTVYAVTYLGDERPQWLWQQLSFEQWARAGYPTPRDAGWIDDSFYHQWATSNELFVMAPDMGIHKLTYSEWRASGFAPPVRRSDGFVTFAGSPTIYYVEDVAGRTGLYAMTYDQWRKEDFPTPQLVNW